MLLHFSIWSYLFLKIFIVWNLLIFFLYGWDKLAAKNHWWRVPEKVLLFTALLMGSFGAMFGMVLWNHKTSKLKFRFCVPVFTLLNMIFFWIFLF
ncbi:MAG: DUF1294 domain-containing protein [Ruminococcaceae bacterium]|nr:DUF1294 domain-containing protein [Oscillospiraceae bacterium]